MYLITGDIHGDIRSLLYLIDKYSLTSNDTIILLGDVGLNFYCDEEEEEKKRILNNTNVQFLCIHGNHEIRPYDISTYKEYEWHKGIVYRERKYRNINFAKDGEIYELGGTKAIAIGGAYSVDKKERIKIGKFWWPNEQPSKETKKHIEEILAKNNWKIDIVVSHTCPKRYIPIEAYIKDINQNIVDRSTEEWLGYIENKLTYKNWYCGHWHINKRIDKMYFLFNGIVELK